MQSIRQYLAEHPEEVEEILDYNESFVIFRKLKGAALGSHGVPVTPERSLAADNRIFLAHLSAGGLRFRPPLGLFRTFKDEGGGIDLKKGGIIPIVSVARVVGIEAGCRSRNTLHRLEAAREEGILSIDGAEGLAEAFRYLHRLRLETQLEAHRSGGPISNTVPLDDLVSLERRHLKDSFAQIREIQAWLAQRFDADRLG